MNTNIAGMSPANSFEDEIGECVGKAVQHLFSIQNKEGYWEGRLSSSPYSTALSIIALLLRDKRLYANEIEKGIDWLIKQQNADGGWGDTDISPSNPPSTILSLAAILFLDKSRYLDNQKKVFHYLERIGGLAVLDTYYAEDRTFSDPIYAVCGMVGMIDWSMSKAFPFEAILFPAWMAKRMRLPIVSFALPILIAIGILQHKKSPSRNPLIRFLRYLSVRKGLVLLKILQPSH